MNETSRPKNSPRELIRLALIDAIGWNLGLAEAYSHMPDAPERAQALDLVRELRAMLKRRYGSGRTPQERALDGTHYVKIAGGVEIRDGPK